MYQMRSVFVEHNGEAVNLSGAISVCCQPGADSCLVSAGLYTSWVMCCQQLQHAANWFLGEAEQSLPLPPGCTQCGAASASLTWLGKALCCAKGHCAWEC